MGEVRLFSPIHAAIRRVIPVFEPDRREPRLAKPVEPVGFEEIFRPLIESGAYEEDDAQLEFPWSLPNGLLVEMGWLINVAPGCASTISYHSVVLPTGERLYVEIGECGLNFLACARPGSAAADRIFLKRLFESNGDAFGTSVIGSPADSLSLGLDAPVTFWVEVFMALFDAADETCGLAWEECEELGVLEEPGGIDPADDQDFDEELSPDRKSKLVEAYLQQVIKANNG